MIGPGKVVTEPELTDQLRAAIGEVRQLFQTGKALSDSHPHDPLAKSRHLTFEGGATWFPNGWDGDVSLADTVANGLRGVAILLAIGGVGYALSELTDETGSVLPAVPIALATVGLAVASFVWFARRTRAAVARLDLGTLLLPGTLVLLSHGRRIVFPKESVSHFEVRTVGTSNRERILHVVYVDEQAHQCGQPLAFGADETAMQILQAWQAS